MKAIAEIKKFSHTVNGNPIAMWNLTIDDEVVYVSKKREWAGYRFERDDAVIAWFREHSYGVVGIDNFEGSREQDSIEVIYDVVKLHN